MYCSTFDGDDCDRRESLVSVEHKYILYLEIYILYLEMYTVFRKPPLGGVHTVV